MMLCTPAIMYLTVGCLHIIQQSWMVMERRVKDHQPFQMDYILQALIMAGVVEVLHQNQIGLLSWVLSAPVLLMSVMAWFFWILTHCSI